MFEEFLFVILIGTYLIYKLFIVPKRQMSHLVSMFQAQGFKVLQLPYNPLGIPFYQRFLEDGVYKDDPYFTHKHQYPAYDILITNMLNQPSIALINANLLREAMSAEKVMVLPKEKKIT